MNAPRCPDKETLFGYVVGTIAEDAAEAVAAHLLACRLCEQTVEALEGLSDTVVSALQQAAPGDAYAEEPACRQLVAATAGAARGRSGHREPRGQRLATAVAATQRARGWGTTSC